MKYTVVTGGVLSGLGKGVVTASIGRILKDRGYNVGPCAMNPYRHEEAHVPAEGRG